ncbi:hypothetical protein ABPG75_013314 [Micractinium tetrahymenae]
MAASHGGSAAATGPAAASAAAAPELLRSLVTILCEEQPSPQAAQLAADALREGVTICLAGMLEEQLSPAALAELQAFIRTAAQLALQAIEALISFVTSTPSPMEASASPEQQALLIAHNQALLALSAALLRVTIFERQAWGQQVAVSEADKEQVMRWAHAVVAHHTAFARDAAFSNCRPCCLCGGPVVQFPAEEEGDEVPALQPEERWLAHAAVLTAREWQPWGHGHPRRDLRRAAAERAAAAAAAQEAAAAARQQAQQADDRGWEEEPEEDEHGDWGYGEEGYGRRCHLSKRGFLRGNRI